jgi:hypothetical protein
MAALQPRITTVTTAVDAKTPRRMPVNRGNLLSEDTAATSLAAEPGNAAEAEAACTNLAEKRE